MQVNSDILFTDYIAGYEYKHWLRYEDQDPTKLNLWIPVEEQQASFHWEMGNNSGNEKCIDVIYQEDISIQINHDKIRFWFGDTDKTVTLDSEEMDDTLCELSDFMNEMEEHYEECHA